MSAVRGLEMYSFSDSVAGRKASGSRCMLKGLLALNIVAFRLLYSNSMRGSTALYSRSLTRFMMTIREARKMVVPMIMV